MKRIFAILLMILLLLSCGCTKEPEPTSIRLPDEMLEHPPAPSAPEDIIVPTDAEFQQYYDLLYQPVMPEELYSLHFVTGFTFDSPEEICLEWFFYNGFRVNGNRNSFTPEETAFLEQNGFSPDFDFAKRTPGQMEQILGSLFGTTLADHSHNIPDHWMYFPDTDSYFSIHAESFYPNQMIISHVEETENRMVIDYTFDNPNLPYWPAEVIRPIKIGTFTIAGNMQMTLRKADDGTWKAVSNQMISEWKN